MRAGELVEDFSLTDDQGETWRLSDHIGSPVLVIFHRHLM